MRRDIYFCIFRDRSFANGQSSVLAQISFEYFELDHRDSNSSHIFGVKSLRMDGRASIRQSVVFRFFLYTESNEDGISKPCEYHFGRDHSFRNESDPRRYFQARSLILYKRRIHTSRSRTRKRLFSRRSSTVQKADRSHGSTCKK